MAVYGQPQYAQQQPPMLYGGAATNAANLAYSAMAKPQRDGTVHVYDYLYLYVVNLSAIYYVIICFVGRW